jgi:hypothetical protein
MITLSPICFALMTPNWVIIISLVSLRDGIVFFVWWHRNERATVSNSRFWR